eukprot:scaffold2.g7217.t1
MDSTEARGGAGVGADTGRWSGGEQGSDDERLALERHNEELMSVARELYSELQLAQRRVAEAEAERAAAAQDAAQLRAALEQAQGTAAAAASRVEVLERQLREADAAAQRDERAWQTRVAKAAAATELAGQRWEARCSGAQRQAAEARRGADEAAAARRAAECEVREARAQAQALEEEVDALRKAAAVNLQELANICRLVQTVQACTGGGGTSRARRGACTGAAADSVVHSMEEALQRVLAANERGARLLGGARAQLSAPDSPAQARTCATAAGNEEAAQIAAAGHPAAPLIEDEDEDGSDGPVEQDASPPDEVLSAAQHSWDPEPSASPSKPACPPAACTSSPARTLAALTLPPGGTGVFESDASAARVGGALAGVVAALESELAALDFHHSELLRSAAYTEDAPKSARAKEERQRAAAAARDVRERMRSKGQQLQQLRAFIAAGP